MTKTLERLEAIKARKIEKAHREQILMKAWRNGATYVQIATLDGRTALPGIGSGVIVGLREKYGSKKVPYKMPDHWTRRGSECTPEKRLERIREISEAWMNGMPLEEIAERFGYKNSRSSQQGIHHFRVKYPDLFPLRGPKALRILRKEAV